MSSLPESNVVIAADSVDINRHGLECCDDMQGAQMGNCEVDSHDTSRPDKGYLTVPVLPGPTSRTATFWEADAVVVGLKLPVDFIFSQYSISLLCQKV